MTSKDNKEKENVREFVLTAHSMKHQTLSNEETRDILITNRLQHNASDLDDTELHTTHSPTNGNMMTNDSLDTTGTTKMLMPHEMVGSSGVSASLGQHSIHHNFGDQLHHGTSFYHSTGGFHNSFHTYSTLNSNSTMITNNHTFSNLIHQQMNNNHHTTASSVPPLIHQQTFYTNHSDNKLPAEESLASEVVKEEAKEIETENDVPNEAEVPPVEENEEPEPEIDIVISNVVCAFSVRCQLALKDIALNGANVEYKRENGMVTMKLRKPYTTASIWSSGKITCTGATSEEHVSSNIFLWNSLD